jgi:hypothetical protein
LGGVPSGEEGGLASTAGGEGVEECLVQPPMGLARCDDCASCYSLFAHYWELCPHSQRRRSH